MDKQPNDEILFRNYVEEQDERCFDILFDKYSARLLRFMTHRIRDGEDAQELVQKTFLLVHRSRKDFRGESKFSTWLWAIAVNLRKDYLRKYTFRARFRSVDSEVEGEASPEDFENRERVRQLRNCITKLPENSRGVIELHWFEELTFGDVARILGISEPAAKTRAHRAYETLRVCLENS